MQLTVLSAETPLVKSFTLRGDVLEKTPYPNAFNFTSHTSTVENIDNFYTQIKAAAAKGHCLLKGDIKRELNTEQRAGSTDSETSTEWVCLDIDGLHTISTVEDFLTAIGLADVSYVVQYSASMGIDVQRGLSAHVFMMLSASVSAPFLKQWLIHLNMTCPALSAEIGLTRTGNALRWPLDITTCQNDKLLYIAPPHLGKGVVDHFTDPRIQLVVKQYGKLPTARLVADVHKNRSSIKDLLNELRKSAGYSVIRDSQYRTKNSVSYLAKPGEAIITGLRQERGFTYFNLNGGDSWGYYHADNSPEFLFNFKGEPTYRTEELLPEYWKTLKNIDVAGENAGITYFAIRDFKTDKLFNGYFDRNLDDVVIAKAANETRLKSFLKQHGQPVPDFVPDWDLQYNPKSDIRYDEESRVINLYRRSEYYKRPTRTIKQIPTRIKRVIESAVGKDAIFVHFINWLAFVFQYREPATTAWVLTGNEGTGKGVLFHHVIAPLLGRHNVSSMLMNELDQQWTGWLETSLVVFIDEVQLSQLSNGELAAARLRNWIVEPYVEIRKMHQEKYSAPNHANFIFASNKPDSVLIAMTDRRYNVGTFQPNRLEMSDEEILLIEKELESFFMYLMSYNVDLRAARTVLDTEDRQLLKSINRTSVDEVADALLSGNLEYLLDQLPSSTDPIFNTPSVMAYRALMEQLLVHGPEWNCLSRDELFVIYDYCIGGMPRSPNKFTAMLKHHRIHTSRQRRGPDVFYGIPILWQHNGPWFDEQRAKYCKQASVTNIHKPRVAGGKHAV